jgi:hypothetical protein
MVARWLENSCHCRLFEKTDLDVMEIGVITGHKAMQLLARYGYLRTSHLVDRLARVKRSNS